MTAWTPADERLLVELLRTGTVTPMETGRPSDLSTAQRRVAEHGIAGGLEVERFGAPGPEALARPGVPLPVLDRAAEMGEAFLASQPNLVLRLGPPRPSTRTLVINTHLDTVGEELPVSVDGATVTGRGAIDAKGPAVAALAGVRAALADRPDLGDRATVLLHFVGGEEGGALGVYGTRQLVERGYVGRLNVVAEPSRLRYLDHATTTMTARVVVEGAGATDDRPDGGDNATLILAHVASVLLETVAPEIERLGATMCVAGVHTGTSHDRVFGSGQLLVNFAYGSERQGARIGAIVDGLVSRAARDFQRRYGGIGIAKRSASRFTETCRLEWLKRGLPVLSNRDPEMERLLAAAGAERETDPAAAFTCDALWLQGQWGYAVVYGPGELGRDGAHTETEHARLPDLAEYADSVARLVNEFADGTGA